MKIEPITVKTAKDSICSCNGCYATNYDPQGTPLGPRVDTIYDISVGHTTLHLCRECIAKLVGAVCLAGGD